MLVIDFTMTSHTMAPKAPEPKNYPNPSRKDKMEEELTAEDPKLKESLDLLVERLDEDDPGLHKSALELLKTTIKTSTSSMTAVPKPLKFLRPHFDHLCEIFDRWPEGELKNSLADILSVIGMTIGGDEQNICLKYRMLSKNDDLIVQWGHEYVRHLALEIGNIFRARIEEDKPIDDLLNLSLKIIPFFMKHNAEADAVDLLLEIESIEKIPDYTDANNCERVCRYMLGCVPYLSPPDNLTCLNTVFKIYLEHQKYADALVVALRLDDPELIQAAFAAVSEPLLRQQMAFMLARQRMWIDLKDRELDNILSNINFTKYYHYLGKELNLLEPKVPNEIYKSHLESSILNYGSNDPPKQSLAAALVNGLVNCGYGTDKLMLTEQEDASLIYRTKDQGTICATASIGLLHMWDIENGLPALDRYLYSSNENIKAGALLGIGIVSTGLRDENDPAFALLADFLESQSPSLRTSAIIALSIAYAGSKREDLKQVLMPIISDSDSSMELSCLASLALGLIFVGSCNGDITTSIMQTFLDRSARDLSNKWTRFMALGLGLLYVGKSDQIEEIIETVRAIDHPIATIVETMVTMCAFCGSGNVLQIQKFLLECATRPYEDEHEPEDDELYEMMALDSEQDPSSGEMMDLNTSMAYVLGEKGGPTHQSGSGTTGTDNSAPQPPEGGNSHISSSDTPLATSTASDAHERNYAANTSVEKPRSEAPVSENAARSASDTDSKRTVNEDAKDREQDYQRREARRASVALKSYCVLGIAVIAMGEDISQEMVMRHFDHLMHYGDPMIRRAVPLAMSLVWLSDPKMKVYETLSRFSHDSDLEVSLNAVFAMGLVGAGTNNARLAQLLRQLAAYYSRDSDTLSIVRIAQGLLHAGKGTLSLSPFNTERQILSPVALGGLLVVALALLDPKFFILGKNPNFLYYLSLSVQPRMLICLDEKLEPLKVNVRVGQAVDVVGQAGRPKTITGWVTYTTPVLLGVGERAELEDDEYISLSSTLEGLVILKKNPDYDASRD